MGILSSIFYTWDIYNPKENYFYTDNYTIVVSCGKDIKRFKKHEKSTSKYKTEYFLARKGKSLIVGGKNHKVFIKPRIVLDSIVIKGKNN